LKFGSYNPTEQKKLGCARTLSETCWLSTLEHLPQFWGLEFHSQSSCCCQEGTSHVAAEAYSCFLLWRHIRGMYQYILWLCQESHKFVCSTAHICNMQKLYGKTCSSKHC